MYLFNQTDAEMSTVIWLCSRLAIIGTGVYIGSKMLMELSFFLGLKDF